MLTTYLWLTGLLHIMVEGLAIEKSSLEHNEDLHEETGYPDSLSGSFYFRPSPRQPFLQLNLIPYPLIFPYGVASSSVDIQKHDVTSSNLFNIPSRMMDHEWWPSWLEQSHPSRFIVKKRNFPKVNREKMVINWRAAHFADETNDPENEGLDAIESNKDTSILAHAEQKTNIDSSEKQTDRLGAFLSPSIETATLAPELEVKPGNIYPLEIESVEENVERNYFDPQAIGDEINKPSSNEENENFASSLNEPTTIDSEKSFEIDKVLSQNITDKIGTDVEEIKSSSTETEEYISFRGNNTDINTFDEGSREKLGSNEELIKPFTDFGETNTSGANKEFDIYENNTENQNLLNVTETPINNEKDRDQNDENIKNNMYENILVNISLPDEDKKGSDGFETSENAGEFSSNIVLEKEKQTEPYSGIDQNGTVYISKESISDVSKYEDPVEITTEQDIKDPEEENEKTPNAFTKEDKNQKEDSLLETNIFDEKDKESKIESSRVDNENNNITTYNQLKKTIEEELKTEEQIGDIADQRNSSNKSNLEDPIESLHEEPTKFSVESKNVDIDTTPAIVTSDEESKTREETPVLVANDHDEPTLHEMTDEKPINNLEGIDDLVIASHIHSEVIEQNEENHFKEPIYEKDFITEPDKVITGIKDDSRYEKRFEMYGIESSMEEQSTPKKIQKESIDTATTADIVLVEEALDVSKKRLPSLDDSFILKITTENQQNATEDSDAIDTKPILDFTSLSSEHLETNKDKADENFALEIKTIKSHGVDIISNERDLSEVKDLEKDVTYNSSDLYTETNTEKFRVKTLNEDKMSTVKSSIENGIENERTIMGIVPNEKEQISIKELSTSLEEVKEQLDKMVRFNVTGSTNLEENQAVIIEANSSLKNIEMYEVSLENNPPQSEKGIGRIETTKVEMVLNVDQMKDKNVTIQHNDNLYEESNIEQGIMNKSNRDSYSIKPVEAIDLEGTDEIITELNSPAEISEENIIRIDSKAEVKNNTNETDRVYSNINEMTGAEELQEDRVKIENAVDNLNIPEQYEISQAHEINGSYSHLIEIIPFNGERSYLEDSILERQSNDSSDVNTEDKISKTESFDISEQDINTKENYGTSTETNENLEKGKESYPLEVEDSTEKNDTLENKLVITIQYQNETVINNTYINSEGDLANSDHDPESNTERDSKSEELAFSADNALEHTQQTRMELIGVKSDMEDSTAKSNVNTEKADDASKLILNEEINKGPHRGNQSYQGETVTSEVLDRPPLITPAAESLEEDELYESDDEYSSESTTENDETEFEEGEEEISENIKNTDTASSLVNTKQENMSIGEIEGTEVKEVEGVN